MQRESCLKHFEIRYMQNSFEGLLLPCWILLLRRAEASNLCQHISQANVLCVQNIQHIQKPFRLLQKLANSQFIWDIQSTHISLHQNCIRHGMTQCNSFNIFNETHFTTELILLESSPVFVLLQDFVLLQRQKLP